MDLNSVNIIIFGGDNYNTLGMIRTLGEKKLAFQAIIVRSHFVIASKSKYLKHKQVWLGYMSSGILFIYLFPSLGLFMMVCL